MSQTQTSSDAGERVAETADDAALSKMYVTIIFFLRAHRKFADNLLTLGPHPITL